MYKFRKIGSLIIINFLLNMLPLYSWSKTISVGSKVFGESYILAEIISQVLEQEGFEVSRRFGLGGTLIAYEALKVKEIDIYPEYTGTLSKIILKSPQALSSDEISKRLKHKKLMIFSTLNFNNTYALAVPIGKKFESIKKISDLKGQSWKAGFSHEFVKRRDGWAGLKKIYGLDMNVYQMDHSLSYLALKEGQVDLIEVYSTDAKIKIFNLRVLEDDLRFFPKYHPVAFTRDDFPKRAREALQELDGKITEEEMRFMNLEQVQNKKLPSEIARDFLGLKREKIKKSFFEGTFLGAGFVDRLRRHIWLTFISVLMGCLTCIPLCLVLIPRPQLAKFFLSFFGLFQTIPSLALLAFFIPVLGIGVKPAILALFLYSLLPLLRNMYVGLTDINPLLLESAKGMGLRSFEIFWKLRCPLAAPIIIAGLRTATVISIGTATLAAFVGAGGLGEPIITGLSLNDTKMILSGAIPAVVLALVTEFIFEYIERRLSIY